MISLESLMQFYVKKPYPKWNVIRLWATGFPLFVCKVPQLDYAPKDVSLCVFGELQYAISIHIYFFVVQEKIPILGKHASWHASSQWNQDTIIHIKLVLFFLRDQISALEKLGTLFMIVHPRSVQHESSFSHNPRRFNQWCYSITVTSRETVEYFQEMFFLFAKNIEELSQGKFHLCTMYCFTVAN